MKDAKGHGSDPRGGQKAVADWRAAERAGAHQTAVQKLGQGLVAQGKAFAKDTSGFGHPVFHGDPNSKLEHFPDFVETGVNAAHAHDFHEQLHGLAEHGAHWLHLLHHAH